MKLPRSEIKEEFNEYLEGRQKLINDLSDTYKLNINETVNRKVSLLLSDVIFHRNTLNVDAKLEEINKDVDIITNKHIIQNVKIIENTMPTSYLYGFKFVGEDAKRQGVFLQDSFKSDVHEQAILASVNNTYKDILQRTHYMNEYTKDIVGNFVRTEVDTIQATGQSFHTSTKVLTEKIVNEGIVIVDRAGKNWKEKTYSEMVIQTKTMQMFRDGTGNRLRSNGILYVYIPSHAGACSKCANHQGNIYFIGHDERLNHLGAAYLPSASSGNIFHPRCRCTYSGWVEEYQDEEETMRLIKSGLKASSDEDF